MAKITKIHNRSILRGKVKKGEDIIAFCDREFIDILDYIYAESLTEGYVRIIDKKGIERTEAFKKTPMDTLGLEFDEGVEITPKTCCNNCIFCFVQQLPDGLRNTLYIKDDDYRLSFISGSYITCTNLKEKDIQRILDYKLSPLYVSVHSTNEEIRKFMLGIKQCVPQLNILRRLIDGGITIHSQIVLVGGINDGEILKNSLQDLYDIGVSTVAIVPVGLTGFRQGKYEISPLNKEQANQAIEIAEDFYKEHKGFSYCSDEMYQIADRVVRDAEYYGEFEQIENGVGLISKFLSEVTEALENTEVGHQKKTVGLFTGVSGESTVLKAKELIEKKFSNIKINIYVVKNDFFGRTVTVTGLVTATDIIKQYGDIKKTEDYFVIPSVMLKEFEDVFLDGITLKQLSKALHKKIIVSQSYGDSFVKVITDWRIK